MCVNLINLQLSWPMSMAGSDQGLVKTVILSAGRGYRKSPNKRRVSIRRRVSDRRRGSRSIVWI